MPREKHKSEEIVAKLRQVDVAVAIRGISVSEFTYHRWRTSRSGAREAWYGGLILDEEKYANVMRSIAGLRPVSVAVGRGATHRRKTGPLAGSESRASARALCT
ncbi:MAG: hypothetical protein AAGC57_19745 [Pseudomonadota bacterium]